MTYRELVDLLVSLGWEERAKGDTLKVTLSHQGAQRMFVLPHQWEQEASGPGWMRTREMLSCPLEDIPLLLAGIAGLGTYDLFVSRQVAEARLQGKLP